MRRRTSVLFLALLGIAVLAGCGSDDPAAPDAATTDPGGAAGSADGDAETPPGEPGDGPLPAVTVHLLGTGEEVDLAGYQPAERPLLVWFWAPRCPSCNREAPDVAAFAAEHADQLDVIGLGTQDGLELAEQFAETHELPFDMLWDPGFSSWEALGVRGQPAARLFAADGGELGSWVGFLPEDEIRALVEGV